MSELVVEIKLNIGEGTLLKVDVSYFLRLTLVHLLPSTL